MAVSSQVLESPELVHGFSEHSVARIPSNQIQLSTIKITYLKPPGVTTCNPGA